jgi:hypothetical protein
VNRYLLPLLVALLAAALLASLAGDDGDGGGAYAIGLWGDLPYSDAQAATGVPNLISDMNRQHLAFSVHDGDIKNSGRCDNNVYAEAKAFFNALRSPAMYTPGDNEWTDCDKAHNGSYDAEERLQQSGRRCSTRGTHSGSGGSRWKCRRRPMSRTAGGSSTG